MAEMSVPTTSLQSFTKSPLCSFSTRKFNSSYGRSAIVSPRPRFCLISKYNSFRFCAALVKAATASSPQRNKTEPMLPPYNVLITGGSKDVHPWAYAGDGGVGVPHWWVKGSLVSLYGLGQSSPHELAFEVELGPSTTCIGKILGLEEVVEWNEMFHLSCCLTMNFAGIGYALAKEFLKAGDSVIICSRSDERVLSALDRLRVETGKQHVWGTKCDVREGEDVKNLVAFAKHKLKYIDIWTNFVIWGRMFTSQELSHPKDKGGGDEDATMDVWVY
ncbi:putative chlorophyll(ide) b reductase NOL, chloroplastic-like isoform X4 [Capsicum annuum]|nr:putative chlorophyll(ide) b reductase NOL, chloroplastic-like isoform X4 [Capsicum annuum]